MSEHSEIAVKLFREGYNCAQAVFAAFCDETGLDRETALKLSSSFGGGMGRMGEVCGAVSGMLMTAGALYGCPDPKNSGAKAEHYRLVRQLAQRFREGNGSILCRELLHPSGGGPKKHSCAELVGCAAEMMDEELRRKHRAAD